MLRSPCASFKGIEIGVKFHEIANVMAGYLRSRAKLEGIDQIMYVFKIVATLATLPRQECKMRSLGICSSQRVKDLRVEYLELAGWIWNCKIDAGIS